MAKRRHPTPSCPHCGDRHPLATKIPAWLSYVELADALRISVSRVRAVVSQWDLPRIILRHGSPRYRPARECRWVAHLHPISAYVVARQCRGSVWANTILELMGPDVELFLKPLSLERPGKRFRGSWAKVKIQPWGKPEKPPWGWRGAGVLGLGRWPGAEALTAPPDKPEPEKRRERP